MDCETETARVAETRAEREKKRTKHDCRPALSCETARYTAKYETHQMQVTSLYVLRPNLVWVNSAKLFKKGTKH
jgi:hypothetical protein